MSELTPEILVEAIAWIEKDGTLWLQDAPPKSKEIEIVLISAKVYAHQKAVIAELVEAAGELLCCYQNDLRATPEIVSKWNKAIEKATPLTEGEK